MYYPFIQLQYMYSFISRWDGRTVHIICMTENFTFVSIADSTQYTIQYGHYDRKPYPGILYAMQYRYGRSVRSRLQRVQPRLKGKT